MDYDGTIQDYKTAIRLAQQKKDIKNADDYKKRIELLSEAKKVFKK